MKISYLSAMGLLGASALHAFVPFSVTAYSSAADSPLVAGPGETLTLLDFEADPVGEWLYPGIAGLSLYDSTTLGVVGSGFYTDSVDADDGSIDGSGRNGQSLGNRFNAPAGNAGYRLSFDAGVLGALPTTVGVVWTDGDNISRPVEALFYDGNGDWLGTITTAALGDGGWDGGTGEDRFLGASDPGGIGSILVRQPGSDNSMELDHLQWIVPIPEPASAPLIAGGWLGVLATLLRRRRSA